MRCSLKYRILIPCPGLGVVRRGYESALAQCAEILNESELFDVLVLGGGVNNSVDKVIPCIKRSIFFRAGKLISPERAYSLEQLTFFLFALKKVKEFKPHVLYLSDELLARCFFMLRKFLRAKYRVLFRNGAPCKPPFDFCDHVQQLSPTHYSVARKLGVNHDKMSLVFPGFTFDDDAYSAKPDEVLWLRDSLGLPRNRKILITVGAIGKNFKRHDYLIDEISKVHPRPFFVILGEMDSGAEIIKAKAIQLLGEDVMLKSVAPESVSAYLRAADLYVHGALSEGFCRSIVEAAAEGKPCLLHDAEVFRGILAEYPYFADFTKPGSLAALVKDCLEKHTNMKIQEEQQLFVRRHYGWLKLKERFCGLLEGQAKLSLYNC